MSIVCKQIKYWLSIVLNGAFSLFIHPFIIMYKSRFNKKHTNFNFRSHLWIAHFAINNRNSLDEYIYIFFVFGFDGEKGMGNTCENSWYRTTTKTCLCMCIVFIKCIFRSACSILNEKLIHRICLFLNNCIYLEAIAWRIAIRSATVEKRRGSSNKLARAFREWMDQQRFQHFHFTVKLNFYRCFYRSSFFHYFLFHFFWWW